jgi:DNA (cytosine-5)-methyltransferase 1
MPFSKPSWRCQHEPALPDTGLLFPVLVPVSADRYCVRVNRSGRVTAAMSGKKPRLLDLFSGAGGAGMGYHRAGFEVIGVDVKAQPHYPFEFHQADAMTFPLEGFDAIHASPPCQAYTTMANRRRGNHPDLIGATRERLERSAMPYILENVHGARRKMVDPLTLSGGMFGLGVHRPRFFEVSFNMERPPQVFPVSGPLGVYGKLDGRRLWTRADGTEQRNAKTLEEAQIAMGVDWMEWDELREAIPPAYTFWLGRQLLAALQVPT